MTHALALANQKGGVGKTTTSVNLAAYLAEQGHRILLADLDPQGNATSSLGVDKNSLSQTTYELLIDSLALEDAVIEDIRPRLDLLPANGILAGAEVELAGMRKREFRLREALAEGREQYAAVIIDCPPSLGLLTINALTAASDVVIPIQCEYLALEGLMQLVNTLDLVRRRLNPALDVLGVVMTMYDARTRLSPQVVNDVRRFFPSRLLRTVIPRAVRLAEAPSYGQTIFEYDTASRAARAYGEVGAEIARRIDLSVGCRPAEAIAGANAAGTSGG